MALQRSSQHLSRTPEGDHPANLAFRALASHRLTRRPEALALQGQLQTLMKQPRWATDAQCLNFLREAEWQLTAAPMPWTALDPAEFSAQHGTTLRKLDDHSLLASGTNPPFETYRIIARTNLQEVRSLRLDVLQHDDLPSHGCRSPSRCFW
jgi:hypothetical protein